MGREARRRRRARLRTSARSVAEPSECVARRSSSAGARGGATANLTHRHPRNAWSVAAHSEGVAAHFERVAGRSSSAGARGSATANLTHRRPRSSWSVAAHSACVAARSVCVARRSSGAGARGGASANLTHRHPRSSWSVARHGRRGAPSHAGRRAIRRAVQRMALGRRTLALRRSADVCPGAGPGWGRGLGPGCGGGLGPGYRGSRGQLGSSGTVGRRDGRPAVLPSHLIRSRPVASRRPARGL